MKWFRNKGFLLRRAIRFWFQRRIRGFSDDELWSLDHTIVAFALPRLKRFKKINYSHPPTITMERWREEVDEIIASMELYLTDVHYDEEQQQQINKGAKLLYRRFHHLWD